MGIANPMRVRDRRPWRRLRLVALALACGLLLTSAISAIRQIATTSRAEVDNLLRQTSKDQAATVAEHFRHTAQVGLLLAHTPAFADREPDPATADAALADAVAVSDGRIVAAALIRSDGRVYARVVDGTPRTRAQRAGVASELRRMQAAFELSDGVVFHSAPYRSTESGRWVVATGTVVHPRGGGKTRLVAVETDLAAFRTLLASSDAQVVSRIVDASGAVIVNSHVVKADSAPIGADTDKAVFARAAGTDGLVNDGTAFRFARVTATTGNENTWTVAASAPASGHGSWIFAGGSASVMALATLILLILGVLAFRRRSDDLNVARVTDPLSGLLNRAALAERGEEVLAHGRTSGHMTAVLCLNLYRFREVNDALGHEAGDSVIREVSERLRGAIRAGDLLVRMGGDEFAVLLAQVENRPGADDAARRILAALHAPFMFQGTAVGVHAVMGGALSPEDGEQIGTLIERAGAAMYDARRRGVDLVFFDERVPTVAADRLSLVSDLREAMSSDQLRLHYQPKVSLQTGKIEGVEAVIRWQHPRLGLLKPGAFIPMAEETGLVEMVTAKTLTLAMAQSRAWLDEGLELPIAVNLSHRCLRSEGLADQVARGLTRWQVPPRLLELEVGATEIVGNPKRARHVLQALAGLGVAVSLDDDGAGEISLRTVRALPVRDFKMDPRHLRDLEELPAVAQIVEGTIELAHDLGLRVVADGVHDAATVRALVGFDCDAAQGDFFCAPLPAAELRRWLLARNGATVAR